MPYILTKEDKLIRAINSKDLNLVQSHLRAGDNVNVGDINQTPLCCAASIGSTEIVNFLLESGADINRCNAHGNTPLAEAAKQGHQHVIEQLIAAGADVNVFENGGRTPLAEAALGGFLEIINILSKNGANLSSKCDGEGNIALTYVMAMANVAYDA